VRLVDGGYLEYSEDVSLLSRLADLEASGYSGKALVYKLITDDWGSPPLSVQIMSSETCNVSADITIYCS
jgi:hypothetical protein